VLSYWEQFTPRETAAYLGISEGSVHRHLARARSKLRRSLDE
jgi:RNA polymerase sigma factor (sigma-70 family)